MACPIVFLMFSFDKQEFLILIKSNVSTIFPLVSIFVLYEILPTLRSARYVSFQKLYVFGFYLIAMILQEMENQNTLVAKKETALIVKKNF